MATSFTPMSKRVRKEDVLEYHAGGRPGKIEVIPTKPTQTARDLSLAYTPGVADVCLEIARDPDLSYKYTTRGNLVAVVSNGTAVLGLGDIGPAAGKPVMEGKGVLFKRFADIDVFDLNIEAPDVETVCTVVRALEPTFGGINLEDIKAPECFIIEERLKKEMQIPVFHDDQHGTAIISAARAPERRGAGGQEAGHAQGRGVGRRRGGDRVRQLLGDVGRQARERGDGRHQGRHLQGAHRGHEPVEGALRE